jgi:hypothetical protein
MTKTSHAWLLAAALLPGRPCPAAPDVPALLLKAADSYRGGNATLQVETQVTTLKRDGSTDKERRYTVFTQSPHRSLVLMRSRPRPGRRC